MAAGIFVVHTPEQARDAGALVDLLESALALPDGALACSSLPGYAWAMSGHPNAAEWDAMLQRVGAAVAIADNEALSNSQWMFDVAAAHGRGLWTVVLLDDATQAARLPVQLTSATLALRTDETSVRAVVEDLAFELGFAPRLGQETKDAITSFSSIPPERPRKEVVTSRPPSHAQHALSRAQRREDHEANTRVHVYESIETVPPPSQSLPSEPPPFASSDEPLELDADELEPIDGGLVLVSRFQGARPLLAFDAGRAISECSFHRHNGGDFVRELEESFGAFINAVGGDWAALARLADIEVWLGATDNLLDSLPPTSQHIADWYELGYQLSTLLSIAEHGGFDDPLQHEAYEELWGQAMTQLRKSGARLQVSGRELDGVQWRLENLVGPTQARDYSNVAGVLEALRAVAHAAQGQPMQPALARLG